MYQYVLFFLACWVSVSQALVTVEPCHDGLILTTLYGCEIIHEPLLIRLIQHPAFERLKNIHQYGAVQYVPGQKKFTRYEHSVGVFFLTRKYGAPLDEQIAALLHDVSHTVFSHVGDVLFKSNHKTGADAYQDTIHEWYLEQVGIGDMLGEYGHELACSSASKAQQRCFEQALPDLCADRIEYTISGGFLDGLITQEEIDQLLQELHFEDGQWFFTDEAMAQKFGYISLRLCESRWGSAWGLFIDYHAAAVLQRALDLDIISLHDIHFSDDVIVWNALQACNDAYINRMLQAIMTCPVHFDGDGDTHCAGRFTGTDPLVKHKEQCVRLSVLDGAYRDAYLRVRSLVRNGYYITLHALSQAGHEYPVVSL